MIITGFDLNKLPLLDTWGSSSRRGQPNAFREVRTKDISNKSKKYFSVVYSIVTECCFIRFLGLFSNNQVLSKKHIPIYRAELYRYIISSKLLTGRNGLVSDKMNMVGLKNFFLRLFGDFSLKLKIKNEIDFLNHW